MEELYHFRKSRKQRARLFINMGVCCLVYIGGLLGYEHFKGEVVSQSFRTIYITAFSLSSIVLFYIAWWHRRNPATYESIVTGETLTVRYPNSEQWSFEVRIADIKRFEHRNSLSHAGKGIGQSGVLLNDGTFHQISMNYGDNLSRIHAAVQKVRPEVPFPKSVNRSVAGPLSKDYDS